MTEYTENQTQFMEDQVVQQQPATVVPSTSAQSLPVVPVKNTLRIKLFVIASFIMFFVVLMVIVMATSIGKKALLVAPAPSPTSIPVTTQTDLEKAMIRLHQDITKADPTVNDLPFPPVDSKLYITPRQ